MRDDEFEKLRLKAEQYLGLNRNIQESLDNHEMKRIIHDLEVHQVELIMQNDELIERRSELEKEKNKYYNLFEFAPIGYVKLNENKRITDSNNTFCELVGIAKSEVVNHLFTEFISAEFQDDFYLTFRQLINGGLSQEVDLKVISKQKSSVWVRIRIVKETDASGFLLAVSDFDLQQKTEFELRKLNTAVNQSSNTIIITNISGEIEYVNPYFEQVTGYSSNEVIGKNPRFLSAKTLPVEVFQNLWETILSGETWKGELFNRKKNGDLFWENVTITPVKNNRQEIVNFIAIKEDITKKKLDEQLLRESEENLRKYSNELKELSATKDKLFSIIAHDLKNPFNTLLGFSNLIRENAPEYSVEQIQEFAGNINFVSNQTYNLLVNLLEWSQLQTGQFNPKLIELKPSMLVSEIVELSESLAKAKNIQITANVAFDPIILADRAMVLTVLRNLVGNAIKFTHPRNSVTIETRKSDDFVLFSVSDTGVGISEVHLRKLFQIDNKFTSPGTNNEQGTGLGLILCKEFVEKHGGRIWGESTSGIGSTFYFTIPLRSPE